MINVVIFQQVYVNLQTAELYEERMPVIADQIHQKLKPKEVYKDEDLLSVFSHQSITQ